MEYSRKIVFDIINFVEIYKIKNIIAFVEPPMKLIKNLLK